MKRLNFRLRNTTEDKEMNIIKSVLVGPVVSVLALAIVYFAWWGIAKLFYMLHGFMTGGIILWLKEAWPYALAIWAFVLFTSAVYAVFLAKKKDAKAASSVVTEEEPVSGESEDSDEVEDVYSSSARESNPQKMDFEDFWSTINPEKK